MLAALVTLAAGRLSGCSPRGCRRAPALSSSARVVRADVRSAVNGLLASASTQCTSLSRASIERDASSATSAADRPSARVRGKA